MSKWTNTSMKMHNYTSSAGRAGILIFALVKYAIFSLKLEKKTSYYFTIYGRTPMSSAVQLLKLQLSSLKYRFGNYTVRKIHREFIYNKCGCQSILT